MTILNIILGFITRQHSNRKCKGSMGVIVAWNVIYALSYKHVVHFVFYDVT